MHDSFLTFKKQRYFWVAFALVASSLIAYLLHRPIGPPNGGSWLGYTLGTVAAVLIVWLMLLGVRKRRYASRMGSVLGWTSAHIYLGTSLIVVSLLHCGFQFGWNIHTACLILMLLVIFSGFFGVFAYLRYPQLMTQNRSGYSTEQMLVEIRQLDQESITLAAGLGADVHDAMLRSVRGTKLGGGLRQQLFPNKTTDPALQALQKALKQTTERPTGAANSTMVLMVQSLAATQSAQQKTLRYLIDLLATKRALSARLRSDVRMQAMLELWLYVHVPLSFALLATLIAHILSVFFYW
jgi:hypothetical protein